MLCLVGYFVGYIVPRQFAHISRSVNIEWGFKGNRVAVIALHNYRKSDSQIFFYCYTVHVVELFNYYTNHCACIKFVKFAH
jgi:hypothetical protein